MGNTQSKCQLIILGPSRGRCSCGTCICTSGWEGTACDCTVSQAACMSSNGQVCNGHGVCRCGVCQCEGFYKGPTCEESPVVSNISDTRIYLLTYN